MFSRFSMKLRGHNAKTMDQLISLLEVAWTGGKGEAAEFRVLTQAADVKAWLAPHLESQLRNIASAHQYAFTWAEYNGTRRVVMIAKEWAASREYKIVGPVLRVSCFTTN